MFRSSLAYPRGPALIVEPVGVTNAPTYQLYIMGFHVVAWSQPDVAWSRRSHVNTIVYMFVLQFVDMGSSAFRGRRSSELRPTHVTCKSEPSHVVGTDGYSLLQFGNISTLHGIYYTYNFGLRSLVITLFQLGSQPCSSTRAGMNSVSPMTSTL